uniref:Glomulin, FKBP associated protein b n=1 Tax=Gouania willdenowi TaxID=441366 RepID=A0A8C5EFW8_GOUWI
MDEKGKTFQTPSKEELFLNWRNANNVWQGTRPTRTTIERRRNKNKTTLTTDENTQKRTSMGWVLLGPLVNKVLTKEKSVDNCQRAVTHLTKICCPHELLQSFYQLIDDIDPGAISDTIVILLPHLQTVLYRLDEGRADAVGRILLGVQTQMSRLPVPFTSEQEDEDEHGLCRCCTALIIFITPLVGELKRRHAGTTSIRLALTKTFCMRSLREPLLDAALDEGRASPLWIFSVEIMVHLFTFYSLNIPQTTIVLFPFTEGSPCGLRVTISAPPPQETPPDGQQPGYEGVLSIVKFSLSTCCVSSPEFVLQCNMEHVTQLLSRYAQHLRSASETSHAHVIVFCWQQKGIPPAQRTSKTPHCVITIVFRCMFQSSNHAGIQSFIVKNIRTQVERDDFLFLFSLVLSLPQGVHTDLLHNMDTIMESLNLVRFVLIRDSELRSRLCSVRDKYLHMLDICINMSRAYYTVQIKELKEDYKVKAKSKYLSTMFIHPPPPPTR